MAITKKLPIFTPLSKTIAATMLIVIPVVGFFLGAWCQKLIDLRREKQVATLQKEIATIPTITPFIATPTPTLPGWKTFTSNRQGFSIQYPPGMTVSGDDRYVIDFTKDGPTAQPGGDHADGIFLHIARTDTGTDRVTVQDSVNNLAQKVGTVPVPIEVGGVKGYVVKTLHDANFPQEWIILPTGKKTAMTIDNQSNDPTGQGFQKIINQMLSTFRLTSH